MSVAAIFAIVLGTLAAGEGAFIGLQARSASKAEAAHVAELSALQAHAEELAADLGECKAQVTAKSLGAAAKGTTDALGAALAPGLAEVQARAGLVPAVTLDRYAQAIISSASPRMLVADAALARCVAMTAVKGADLTGCGNNGPVVQAWVGAVEAQAGCPDPGVTEGQGE